MNGNDGTSVSGTMLWKSDVDTRVIARAPILTCSMASLADPSVELPNTLTSYLPLVALESWLPMNFIAIADG